MRSALFVAFALAVFLFTLDWIDLSSSDRQIYRFVYLNS